MTMHFATTATNGPSGSVAAACWANSSNGLPRALYLSVTARNIAAGFNQGVTYDKSKVTCGNCKRTRTFRGIK